MTKEELKELNQTAYDTVVSKLLLMKDFGGSSVYPFNEVYFKGEITTIRVVIEHYNSDSTDEIHSFAVIENSNINYGSRTLYNYTFRSSEYELSPKFSEFIKTLAKSYQNAQDARVAEDNRKQAIQDRIDAAMRLKNFVSSF